MTNPTEILLNQKLFYERLYTSKIKELNNRILNNFINQDNIKQLTEYDKTSCEGIITEDEAISVLKHMKNNKTPGMEGLPAEFYKILWRDIGKYCIKSINEAYIKGEMSITQKQCLITCIPKGDKPRHLMKNWRPLSLLNTDFKILSGVLADRIKKVLPNIISSDQKGFLKNRFIGENGRLVYDVISHLNDIKGEGIIVLIDFQKAFDTLEWKYINTVLRTYNFG